MGLLAWLRRSSWRRRLLIYAGSFLTVIGAILGFVLIKEWAVPAEVHPEGAGEAHDVPRVL